MDSGFMDNFTSFASKIYRLFFSVIPLRRETPINPAIKQSFICIQQQHSLI